MESDRSPIYTLGFHDGSEPDPQADILKEVNKEIERQNARDVGIRQVRELAYNLWILSGRLNKTDKKELKELFTKVVESI